MYKLHSRNNPNEPETLVATCLTEGMAISLVDYLTKEGERDKISIPKFIVYDYDGNIQRVYPGKTTLTDVGALSVRSYNCLLRHGVTYVEDLYKMSANDILSIRNLGRKCAAEVLKFIAGCLVDNINI